MWLLFAVMIAIPSAQLARLLRVRRAPQPQSAPPTVVPAEKPIPGADSTRGALADSSSDDPGFRYEPIGPSRAPIAAAAISSTGRLVAVLDDSGEVTVWDAHERKRLSRFPSEQRRPRWRYHYAGTPIAVEEILGMGLHSATVVIGGNDGRFRAWSAARGSKFVTAPHSAMDAGRPEARRAPLVDVETPPLGGLFSVSSNGSLALWSGQSDTSFRLMTRSPGGNVHDIDIGSDGHTIAVASAEAVYLLAIRPAGQTWTPIDSAVLESDQEFDTRLRSNPGLPLSRRRGGTPQYVKFSPGGGLLASSWSNGEIRVYSVASHDQIHTIRFGNEGRPARFLSFSPDGRLLAATDGNRIIQLWSMNVLRTVAPVAITAPYGPVRSMWFTPDGKRLVVSGYKDRYLRALPIPVTP
jgi:WD40 repeat protein